MPCGNDYDSVKKGEAADLRGCVCRNAGWRDTEGSFTPVSFPAWAGTRFQGLLASCPIRAFGGGAKTGSFKCNRAKLMPGRRGPRSSCPGVSEDEEIVERGAARETSACR